MNETKTFTRSIADAVFSVRPLILLLFVLGTAAMVYYSLQLRVDAGFKKQLPLEHEYMQTFLDYEENFGGANRVMVALIDRDGDMFTPEFFRAFEELSEDTLYVTGVDRSTGRSIFTPNVRFVEVVEDGFAGGNVIPADFAPTPEMLETVRSNIIKSGEVGRLVAEDFSGAMVWVNLLEENPETGEKLDYQQVAAELEQIRETYENDEHVVRIIGFAKIVGDVADGARGVVMYFGVAFLITALILLVYSHSIWLTVLPLVCSVTAVIWQLGLLSVMGFGIDPMNILTPFLIFAIGVSHGVQMISGWNAEKLFGGYSPIALVQEGIPLDQVKVASSLDASKNVFARLLAPGSIALLSDTIGFLTILLINIQIIQELAITASIGVAVIILTNLVLLPVLLSYVRLSNEERKRQKQYENSQKPSIIWDFMAKFTHRGVAVFAVLFGVILFAAAWVKSQDMQIGDSEAGVPELREDARYNIDAREIQERFSLGTDVISVIAQTEASACIESHQIMESIDRFAWHMRNVEGVQRVITLPMVAKQVNAGWNEGNLRWQMLPRDRYALALTTQNIPTDSGLLNRDCSAMPVMIFTEDHKAETINRVVGRAEELQAEIQIDSLGYEPGGEPAHGNWESEDHPPLVFRLATGNVGVMAATNQEVAAAQTPMLLYVYSAIVVLCLITFRSVLGTLCIVLPLVLVSYLAYSLMAFMGIGLKVNTLPVVALGVGIGVDYGIYIFSRMKGFLDQGVGLDDAYYRTLRLTGRAVFYTAVTLAVGVGTWLFSELQFQADMGLLLAFMFVFNMIGAMLLLPALARVLLAWREKRA
jgi:predicted RND superfamily exporter protein